MNDQTDGDLAAAILETVGLPLLAVDGDLRVESANEAFLRQFRVSRAETVGRLIYDLGGGQWNIPELRRLLGEILPGKSVVSDYRVARDFGPIGHRVMHINARRIVRPRQGDLILLAISDDTEREALRAELAGRIELADKLIGSVREGLLILDAGLRVHFANASFYETFGVEPARTVGRLVYDLGNGQWNIPELRQLLEDVLPRARSFDDYEVAHSFEGIGPRVMVLNGRRLDHMDRILLAIRDVTDIRESRTRLREVATAAHIGVFDDDRRTGALYWSPEMRDILGYPRGLPPPSPGSVPDFVHPEDRTAVADMLAAGLDPRGDGVILHEHRIVRPDGGVRWIQIHGRTEGAADAGGGRPARIRGVVLDVTERKAAEEKLRATEERREFRLALGDALKPLAEPSEVTATATRLLGERLGATRAYYVEWPAGETRGLISPDYAVPGVPSLEGRCPAEAFRPSRDRLARGDTWTVEDVVAAPGLDAFERRRFLDAGAVAWIDVPLVREGGLRAALRVVEDRPRRWTEREIALAEETADRCWDALERVRADARQRQADLRYRALFDALDQGFCVIEVIFDAAEKPVEYRFLDVNAAFERQTGLRDAVGKTMRSLNPEHEEHWFETYGRIARTRRPERFENAANALGHYYEVYAFPFGEPEEHKVGVLFNDVGERKRAEEHQDMLMAELDHRVKNILAVVQSIARQSFRHGQGAGADAAERLVGRIGALAESHRLLASSRWKGARFGDLVQGAVAAYRGDREGRIVTGGPDLKVTPKAAQTLTLALHELVTNAAKYGSLSRGDGSLTATWRLSGEGDDRRLRFTWQERGGPPIEEAPSRKGFGSRLIERTLGFELGGDVTLDFAREGVRAVIDLPLAGLAVEAEGRNPGHRREKPPASDPATLRHKRILLVEDDYFVGQETAEALRSAGCSVTGPVGVLSEALRQAVAADFDAAVLDINLNGDLVWPTARALKARGIPVLFASGYSDTMRMPPELADVQLIEKPFEAHRLVTTLAAAVGGCPGS